MRNMSAVNHVARAFQFFCCLTGLLLLLISGTAHTQTFGSDTGLNLPRFVSLKAGRSNVRTGPGREFPIRWVFTRPNLPIKVIDEAEVWRKIEDYEGETGWLHESLLAGSRYVMVMDEPRPMLRTPSPQSLVTASLDPMVVLKLIRCESNYCRVEIENLEGWVERQFLWGVLPSEWQG